jgi:hypothetical protein
VILVHGGLSEGSVAAEGDALGSSLETRDDRFEPMTNSHPIK